MSVIKLRSGGMLGQRKADLGLLRRKKQDTRTSLIPKFPRGAIVKTPQRIENADDL